MPFATRRLLFLPLVAVFLWASGCAHSYDAINADTLTYRNAQSDGGFAFSYRYDALIANGNKNYSKEADEERISVVAVRVTNNTRETVLLDRGTLRVAAGGAPLGFAQTDPTVDELQQRVWPYVFFAIPITFETDDSRTTLPFLAPIGLFNIIRGVSANNKLKNEFEQDALLGQEVAPGATAYGLVYLRDTNMEPLTFSIESAPQARRDR